MNTTQWYVLVRTKDEPGAGVYQAYLNSDNSYNAIQQAKAMYGRLLLSEAAMPVPENSSWNG